MRLALWNEGDYDELVAFKMETSYRTKRCLFDINRIILTMLSKPVNLVQK